MQAAARLAASAAASKRVIAGISSTSTRSCYRASRGKAHAAPLSAQEPPPKGQKRISKQERRVMIEEFVDKYRASNGGKFPTITHVRQQIGGSHYTVRGILQELEYHNANPPLDNAKAAQGQGTAEVSTDESDTAHVQGTAQLAEFTKHSRSTDEYKEAQGQGTAEFAKHSRSTYESKEAQGQGTAQFAKHSRSTDESKATQVQGTNQLAEHSWPKDDNEKKLDDFEAFKSDQQDDVLLSLKDATAGTATIEKTETWRSMGSDHITETEAAKLDSKISDSIKNADDPTLSDQTESDSMKDLTNEAAISLGVEAKSDSGKQEGETEVNKLDLNNTGYSLNASKSTLSDQSGSDKLIKENFPDSEQGHKHEAELSTETSLLGSLKSFAYGIRNFWKGL